jgi:hypothetical protein
MDVGVSIQNDDVTCHGMGITAHVDRYGSGQKQDGTGDKIILRDMQWIIYFWEFSSHSIFDSLDPGG